MTALSLTKAPAEAPTPFPRSTALPRVNLLPPEIEEQRRFRRVQLGLGSAAAGTVGLVALLYLVATGATSTAQAELADAEGTNARLQTEAAAFRDVSAVYERAATAEAMLTQAMGQEVRWSRLLNDLSLTVPDNVWVKNLSFTQSATVAGGTGVPGIGSATFTGVAYGHDDVAVWLESLAGQKGYQNPYFSASTESLLGTRKIVTFTSTTTVTPAALSGRYTPTAGD